MNTPGPWRLEDRDRVSQHGVTQEVGPFIVVARNPEAELEEITIAEVQDDGEPGVALADARLIAAAPELLTALKNAVIALDDLDKSPGVRADPRFVRRLEDIIAKAEGR